MITRSALFFPLVLALLLALITFWINLTVEQQGPKIDGSNRHDPDYMMNNFVTTQTDVAGKLRYILAATQMMHYPDDDSTVLQRPRFTQYTVNKPYTQIEGLRGYVSSNGEQIELVDNVKVVRQAFDGKGEMQVLTEKLTILPKQDIAKTDSPVVITQAPKTVIHATGMIFDKKNKTVKLLSRVKVHYERPQHANTVYVVKPSAKLTNSNKANSVVKPNLVSQTSTKKLLKSTTAKKNTINMQVNKRQTINKKSRSNHE